MDLRGWRVDQRDVRAVVGRISAVRAHRPLSLQRTVLEGAQRCNPRLLRAVQEGGVDPAGALVYLWK